jgi:hypothetical protein
MACRGTQTVLAFFSFFLRTSACSQGIESQNHTTTAVILSVAKNPEVFGFRFCALLLQRLFVWAGFFATLRMTNKRCSGSRMDIASQSIYFNVLLFIQSKYLTLHMHIDRLTS